MSRPRGPSSDVECRLAAIGDDCLVAERGHRCLEQPALHGIVIDDENAVGH